MPARVYDKIDEVVRRDRLPIVVFDLDSTLFDTAGRNLAILREFSEAFADRHPDLADHVGAIRHADLGWSVVEPLQRRGITDKAVLDALLSFWKERFFTSEYVLHDLPAPGAVRFVTGCHARGALVYYLTGRHVGGMEVGTVQALTNAGFPYWRGRCVLHLKPSFTMPDKAYKEQAIGLIRSYHGEVVATFENEPGNANVFLQAFPDALHYLFGTVRSPDGDVPHADLVEIHDFYAE